MAMIKVSSDELQSLSQNIAVASTGIQDQLNRLQGEIAGVVDADWAGAASARFSELWDEWQRSAVRLQDTLDGMSRLLAHAATQYEQAEAQIRSSMG